MPESDTDDLRTLVKHQEDQLRKLENDLLLANEALKVLKQERPRRPSHVQT